MARSRSLVTTLFTMLAAALSCVLLFQAIGYGQLFPDERARAIDRVTLNAQGGEREASLPENAGGFPAHASATVTFSADVTPGDVLFLHTVYTSYRVYANNGLIGAFGGAGSAPPPFFSDPPSNAAYVALDGISGRTDFRIEFTTPASRDSLYLYPLLLGSQSAVLGSLLGQYGASLLFSIVFLFLGFTLIVFSLPFYSYETRGRRFRYPGLVALFSGTWQFSENTLSVYLLQCPSLLYVLAFGGMFLLTLPLVKLTMLTTGHVSSPLLKTLEAVLELSILVAFALQLAGAVQLSQSARWFTVLLPVIIWTLTAYCFYYGYVEKNRATTRYAIAVAMLAAGSALEALNWYFRVVGLISEIFQVFMLAFVVVAAMLATEFAQHVYAESLHKLELERDVQLLERSIDAQREHNEMMLEHEQELRKMRHDMRHHLLAIREMAREGRYEEIADYVNALDASAVDMPSERYCENPVANSMCAHYAAQARQRGYVFDAKLDIPANMRHLSDGDLCVIIGNLLENAFESCAKVHDGTPQIVFRAHRQGPMLFMTLDNSLGEDPRRTGGGFATSKEEGGHGIGLRSILAVAERHNGEAVFEAADGMFHSSLYLEI